MSSCSIYYNFILNVIKKGIFHNLHIYIIQWGVGTWLKYTPHNMTKKGRRLQFITWEQFHNTFSEILITRISSHISKVPPFKLLKNCWQLQQWFLLWQYSCFKCFLKNKLVIDVIYTIIVTNIFKITAMPYPNIASGWLD